MNLNKSIDFLKKYRITSRNSFDDISDRLNTNFTSLFLTVTAVVTLLRNVIVKPISCYIANDVGGINLLEYVEYYCYTSGTVYVNETSDFPRTTAGWDELSEERIGYYQWVYVLLAVQITLVCTPKLLWRVWCQHNSFCSLQSLSRKAYGGSKLEGDDRHRHVRDLAVEMSHMFQFNSRRVQEEGRQDSCFKPHTMVPPLFSVYVVVKLLYLGIVVGHFCMAPRVISPHLRWFFGPQLLANIWSASGSPVVVFPHSTVCYVRSHQLTGPDNGAVAVCALPLNLLLESVAILLWFWLLFIGVCSAVSLVCWLRRVLQPQAYFADRLLLHRAFSHHIIPASSPTNSYDDDKKKLLRKNPQGEFLHDWLRMDGIFIVRMFAHNAGDIFVGELIHELWTEFDKVRHCSSVPKTPTSLLWSRL